jgi:hypothetical protein
VLGIVIEPLLPVSLLLFRFQFRDKMVVSIKPAFQYSLEDVAVSNGDWDFNSEVSIQPAFVGQIDQH